MYGNVYDCKECPKCGALMWNGKCENIDCIYHYYPLDDNNEDMPEI